MSSVVLSAQQWADSCQCPAAPLSSAYRCAADAVLVGWHRDMRNSTFVSFGREKMNKIRVII